MKKEKDVIYVSEYDMATDPDNGIFVEYDEKGDPETYFDNGKEYWVRNHFYKDGEKVYKCILLN